MKSVALLGAAAAVFGSLGVSGQAQTPRKPNDVSIPFVSNGGVKDWRATNDRTVYIQGQAGQWFKAETMGVCLGLDFEDRIGFDGGGTDTFDKFSRLIVRGQPCPIETLVKVDGPPASKPKPQDKK